MILKLKSSENCVFGVKTHLEAKPLLTWDATLFRNTNEVLGFPGGSVIKNLPQMQEMHVRSQGLEDLLEEGMATHFSILTWRIPWTEKPGGLQSMGSQRIGYN